MSESSVAAQPFYSRDRCTLDQGDCLEILPTLPANSVDLIFADPPYNLSNDGFTCHGGRAVSVNKGDWDRSQGIQQDFEFHKAWIQECRRLLKPNGTIWISGTYHNIYTSQYLHLWVRLAVARLPHPERHLLVQTQRQPKLVLSIFYGQSRDLALGAQKQKGQAHV
jgi:tRNA1(Val) A37 N6-methylase TrmN6